MSRGRTMTKAKPSTSDNHAAAPVCAAFVAAMRAVFGDSVRVLYVKEGEIELGRREVEG